MLRQTQIDAFDKLLHSLDSINVLPAILIVGSWAEYLYKNCNILDYQLTMRTQDVDVLIKNKNIPRIAVNKVLKENGFILIPDQTGLTKFDYLGELEVEFLIREIGKGQLEPYKTGLNVTAQGLRHMDILVKYSLEILYKDYALYVPSPFAYILHKLIINKKRKSYKQEKDADAVRNLFDAISDEEKNSLKIVFNTDITTKERKAVLEACDKFKELLLPISKFLQS